MLMLGLRLRLDTVERIIMTVIALYEFMIVLRVHRLNIIQEGPVSAFLVRATEPVLSPIRETIFRITGTIGIDFSPIVGILLCELMQWIVKLIF